MNFIGLESKKQGDPMTRSEQFSVGLKSSTVQNERKENTIGMAAYKPISRCKGKGEMIRVCLGNFELSWIGVIETRGFDNIELNSFQLA